MRTSGLLHAAIRVSLILMGTEILITLILQSVPHRLTNYEMAVVDAVALVVVSIPPICLYVVKPYLDARFQMLNQMREISLADPLTHLANAHLVLEHLDRVVAGCTRHKEYCAVLLINLDNFRIINDEYGYEAGNEVLVEVARRLRAATRADDVIGRLGDDEFVILLERLESNESVSGETVLHIAQKLLGVIDMPIAIKSGTAHVSASVGIRMLGADTIDAQAAIKESESAMHFAKLEGGGRAVIY